MTRKFIRVLSTGERHQHWLFSTFFLVLFGAMGFVYPFMTLHFASIGFSGIQISLLMTVSSLVLIGFAPRFGLVLDNSRKKRIILVFSCFLIGLAQFTVPFLRLFVPVLILWTIFRTINTPLASASENLAYRSGEDKTRPGSNKFGSIRLWGSIGYAFFALIGGWLYQNTSFVVNNTLFLVMMVGSGLILCFLPERVFEPETSQELEKEKIRLNEVLKLILKDRFLWMMIIALALTDPLQDGIRSFEPIFMKELGITEVAIGLASTLSAIGEVPFMLTADRLIRRFGLRKMIVLIILFDLTRRLLIWLFPLPELVFILNVLTCISFTIRLVCTVSLINQRVHQRYSSTAIVLVSVTIYGIGHMISNSLTGVVFDKFGGQQIYLMAAGLCILSLIFAISAGKAKPESLAL